MLLAIGNKVLLSTHILNLTGSCKFKDQYVGPFVVQQRIGEVAYRLDLLLHAALRSVHPVFHVSLLQQWRSNGLHHTAPPVDVDNKLKHEVHRMKAYCMRCDELQFLTSLVGYDGAEDMWLSAG